MDTHIIYTILVFLMAVQQITCKKQVLMVDTIRTRLVKCVSRLTSMYWFITIRCQLVCFFSLSCTERNISCFEIALCTLGIAEMWLKLLSSWYHEHHLSCWAVTTAVKSVSQLFHHGLAPAISMLYRLLWYGRPPHLAGLNQYYMYLISIVFPTDDRVHPGRVTSLPV